MAYNYDVKGAGDTLVYIPAWEHQRSNFKLGVDPNPVKFTLRCVTMKDSEEWSKRAFAMKTPAGVGLDGEANEDEANLELSKQQIIAGIEDIENLSLNGIPITTGEELWGTPFKDLILEVGRAIANWSVLTAGDIENLRPASVGSTAEITTPATSA